MVKLQRVIKRDVREQTYSNTDSTHTKNVKNDRSLSDGSRSVDEYVCEQLPECV